MHRLIYAPLIAAAFFMTFTAAPVWAGHGGPNVLVTPLGVLDGDFCGPDRALLFEDPDGTTILFDPGRTVRGPTDARLEALVGGAGNLDGLVLSSVHQDHLGEKFITSGNCDGSGASTSTTPNSNTAEILAGHPGAFMPAAGELRGFMRAKLADAGGSSGQTDTLRPGGRKEIGGVTVAIMPAFHSNGIGTKFLTPGDLKDGLDDDGLTAYVGPDNGFILTFSNGLVVYLTADTGQFGDMGTIAGKDGFYGANLAVVNMGGKFSMGPEEAAWAVKRLIKPKSVIPSHANQVSTTGGVVNADTNLERFIDLLKGIPIHIPLSNRTMEFDGNGRCVAGFC